MLYQTFLLVEYQFAHVNFFTSQQVALDHIFIHGWDPVREVHAYPPATGKLAVYSQEEFHMFTDFTIKSWVNIENDNLGPLFRNSSFWFCVEHYHFETITRDLKYNMNNKLEEHCITLEEENLKGFNNSKQWMQQADLTIPWHSVENLKMNFTLTTITLKPLGPVPNPECFQLHVSILFDNKVVPYKLKKVGVHNMCRIMMAGSRYYLIWM